MTRLLIICEGKTEGEFVEKLLAPHLQTFEIHAYPSLLHVGPKQKRGGNVSVSRLAKHIRNEYHNRHFITTLVDYYGFKDVNGRPKAKLEQTILNEAQTLIKRNFETYRVRPYVQMYEFEALLFSDISKFELHKNWNNKAEKQLQRICGDFKTPEDINNSTQTAPSKRLDDIFPGYGNDKTLYGPLIAEDIGLDTIREKCPLFNQWIGELEQLNKAS